MIAFQSKWLDWSPPGETPSQRGAKSDKSPFGESPARDQRSAKSDKSPSGTFGTSLTEASPKKSTDVGILASPVDDPAAWREWIEERAAIHEYEAGKTRPRAERLAYIMAVVEMQNRLPNDFGVDRCAACDEYLGQGGNVLGDGAVVHYGGRWALVCWRKHMTQQQQRAMKALTAMGITAPGMMPGTTNDTATQRTDDVIRGTDSGALDLNFKLEANAEAIPVS